MSINTANGVFYSAPRVIETKDTRGGCPGTAADGSLLFSQTFTVDNACVYWTHARIIFYPPSRGYQRADFNLRINGSVVKYALDTSLNSNGTLGAWEELDATYMNTLSAGTHTIAVYGSNGANCWGCGSDWGNMTTVVWEAA